MAVNDITTFAGTFVHADDGRRYTYEASFNAHLPIAWKADLRDADGWTCRLAGALIDEMLTGPQLRAALNAAIAVQIHEALSQRQRTVDAPAVDRPPRYG